MVTSEEHLAQAVDEVLEQAWFREQRRARRRLAYCTLGRIALGLAIFWAVAIVAHLIVGVNIPWVLFGVAPFSAPLSPP
jgi:hypothetical protein